MISDIRHYFKSGSQVVLWIVLFSFILGLLPSAIKQATQTAQWAVNVNGTRIDYAIFKLEASKQRDYIESLRKQYGDWIVGALGSNDPQSIALRTLARQEVVRQFAQKIGLGLSADYVVSRLQDPMFVQENLRGMVPVSEAGTINCELLNRYLRFNNISAPVYEDQLERVLAEHLMLSLVDAAAYVPQYDINQHMFAHHAKRSFTVLTIPQAPILAEQKKKSLTDAQIAQFYDEQNQKMRRYWVAEKRSGMVWTFEPKNYKIEISESEINANYEQNKVKMYLEQPAMVHVRRILCADPEHRAETRQKAAGIREQLRGEPHKFSALAKAMSDDAQTAKEGGLMKPFARGTQDAALDRAAFLLPEDGAISDVIETTQGYEIVQRVSKKPQAFKPFSAVKSAIREELAHAQFEKLFAGDLKRVIEQDAAAGNEQALLEFIKEKGGKAQVLTDRALDGMPLVQKLFSLRAVGDANSFVEDQKGIAIKLTGITPTYLSPLESIKKTVIADLYTHLAQEELASMVKKAKEGLANATMEQLKGTYKGELTHTGWLESATDSGAEALRKKGLPVEEMLQLEKKDTVLTHVGPEAGYLVRLDDIAPLSGDKNSTKADEIRAQFKEERKRLYQEGFIASLYRNATIETNDQLITIHE